MSALLRLLWRPRWLLFGGALFVLPFIPGIVLLVLAPEGAVPQWSEHSWLLVSLWWVLAMMLGFVVAVVRLQLLYAPFSWGLPDLRRRLMAGTVVVGVGVAAPAVLVPGLGLPGALAAFALTLFAFVLAGSIAEVTGRSQWAFVALLFGFLFLRQLDLGAGADVAQRWPAAAAVLALAGAGLLLVHQFSARTARARHERWSLWIGGVGAKYWEGRRMRPRRWTGSLAMDRLIPWLRAAEWEGAWGSAGYRLAPVFAVHGVVVGLLVHLFNEPGMAVWGVGLITAMQGFQLGPALPYPVSRALRSRVAAWGATLQLVLIGGMMALTIAGAGALGLPVLREERLFDFALAPALGTALALAPVAQWAHIRWGDQVAGELDPHTAGRLGVAFGYVIAAFLAAHLTARTLSGAHPLVVLGALTTAALLLQIAFHAAVRRHYARVDLVFAASGTAPVQGTERGAAGRRRQRRLQS